MTKVLHIKPIIKQIALDMICLLATLCIAIIYNLPAQAQAQHQTFYCQERKLGWHFYCETPQPNTSKDIALSPPAPTPTIQTAQDEVEAIRTELQELRAEAVLRPTEASIKTYITFQRKQLDRASLFSDLWRRVIWANPDLDYTLVRPVGQTSKRDWIDQRTSRQEKVLKNLHKQYGLMYLYSSKCSACQQFSPILYNFATTYNIDVKAISIDGGSNRYFPNAATNQGQIAQLGLKDITVPAVLLFDSFTESLMPVSFGIVSQSELIQRVFILTQIDPGADY